ncbi:MAG: hypothetical protein WCA78_06875 [Rhizomicrobium sp.]
MSGSLDDGASIPISVGAGRGELAAPVHRGVKTVRRPGGEGLGGNTVFTKVLKQLHKGRKVVFDFVKGGIPSRARLQQHNCSSESPEKGIPLPRISPPAASGDTIFISCTSFCAPDRSDVGIQSARFKRLQEIFLRKQVHHDHHDRKNRISSRCKTQLRGMEQESDVALRAFIAPR